MGTVDGWVKDWRSWFVDDARSSVEHNQRARGGWYPDPTTAGLERYWDGRQWTDGPRLVPPRPARVRTRVIEQIRAVPVPLIGAMLTALAAFRVWAVADFKADVAFELLRADGFAVVAAAVVFSALGLISLALSGVLFVAVFRWAVEHGLRPRIVSWAALIALLVVLVVGAIQAALEDESVRSSEAAGSASPPGAILVMLFWGLVFAAAVVRPTWPTIGLAFLLSAVLVVALVEEARRPWYIAEIVVVDPVPDATRGDFPERVESSLPGSAEVWVVDGYVIEDAGSWLTLLTPDEREILKISSSAVLLRVTESTLSDDAVPFSED